VIILRCDIRIFDDAFNFLGEISDYEEFIFTRRMTKFGEFQIAVNINKPSSELFKIGHFIYLDRERSGIIEHIERKLGGASDKGETLFVKGFTSEYFLTYRVTYPPPGADSWSMFGNGENVIKSLIRYNMGDTALNRSRVIPFIEYAESLNRGTNVNFSTDYKRLDEEISSVAELSGLGIKMCMDVVSKKFIFDVFVGKDLRSSQAENPPVIFSSEYDNVLSQCYTESHTGYKNTAVVDSRGDGATRGIIVVGDNISAENRREVYVSGRDIPKEQPLLQTERGLLRLNEMKSVKTLDGVVNPHHSFKYGTDYNLGDLVTMKYGDVVLHAPITEVTEKWTVKGGYNLEATFGKRMPTLIDKIKMSLSANS
jgi:hypothetical protein